MKLLTTTNAPHPGASTRRPRLMTQRHLITCATLILEAFWSQASCSRTLLLLLLLLHTSTQLSHFLPDTEHLLTAHNKNTVSCVIPTFYQPNVQSTDCCSAYLPVTVCPVGERHPSRSKMAASVQQRLHPSVIQEQLEFRSKAHPLCFNVTQCYSLWAEEYNCTLYYCFIIVLCLQLLNLFRIFMKNIG